MCWDFLFSIHVFREFSLEDSFIFPGVRYFFFWSKGV